MRDTWKSLYNIYDKTNDVYKCHIGRLFWKYCDNNSCFDCPHCGLLNTRGFVGNMKESQDFINGDRMRNYLIPPKSEDITYNYLYYGLKGFAGSQEYVDIILNHQPPQKGKANGHKEKSE